MENGRIASHSGMLGFGLENTAFQAPRKQMLGLESSGATQTWGG